MGFWLCSNSLVGSQITQEVKIICTQPRAHLFLDLIDARKHTHTHTTNFVSGFFPSPSVRHFVGYACESVCVITPSLSPVSVCHRMKAPQHLISTSAVKVQRLLALLHITTVRWSLEPAGTPLEDWVTEWRSQSFFFSFFSLLFFWWFFFANAPFCLIDLVFYLFINVYVLFFFAWASVGSEFFAKTNFFAALF